MNRVNPSRKIFELRDTVKVYLYSPWMIPDAIVIILSCMFTIMGKPLSANYVQIIRFVHCNESMFPINICIENYTNSGQKRIKQLKGVVYTFYLYLLLIHVASCIWIYLGLNYKDSWYET